MSRSPPRPTPLGFRARLLVPAVVIFGVLAFAGREADAAQRFDPVKVKAAFIFNFARYIEWPPARFAAAESPLMIGVVADARVADELRAIVQTRQVHGRSIFVTEVETLDEAQLTHLLYVAPAGERRFAEFLPGLRTSQVVTVGESAEFHERGGALVLYVDHDRLRFRVNADVHRSDGVKFSSQLLKLASSGD